MKISIKIFLIFLFVFALFSIGKYVQANSIDEISMDIYVDNKGNAYVTEVWKCRATEGTELYHPYYNLGKSEIKNLTVMEKNTQYTTLSSWDTSGSLSSKANKCGLNKTSNGVELCWGISQYGSHTYTIKYTITNFVSELTDSQMIYWTLIPYDFSTSIGNVYIKIHTNFDIADTIDVWGYGNYGGTAYVYDGYIEMQSDGDLSTDEYMTILVKFPLGTFNTTNKLSNNFEHYYNMAEEGADKYTDSRGVFRAIITIAIIVIVIFIVIFIGVNSGEKFKFGPEGKNIPKDVPYFRDIPCKKDIFRAYYIGHQYGLLKNKTDLLGAIILKWLKNSIIRIEKKEEGTVFKKENAVVVLNETDPSILTDEKEKELFTMLYEASKDGLLESNEFEKWCRNSYTKILSWFDDIIEKERYKLFNEGLIILEEKSTLKIFNKKVYTATAELKQEAIELAGLKRYLNEYTLIKDREAIEVELFEEYLIYAQIMGIAKEVAKDFKDLYPEVIEQSNYNSYDNIMFVHMWSTSGVREANSAKARAQSYSSGGGGFSSGGGGGGSFGGGGGGRRLPLIYK